MFILASSTIGIGFMTTPAMTKTSGIVLSLMMIVMCSCASSYGSFLLSRGGSCGILWREGSGMVGYWGINRRIQGGDI